MTANNSPNILCHIFLFNVSFNVSLSQPSLMSGGHCKTDWCRTVAKNTGPSTIYRTLLRSFIQCFYSQPSSKSVGHCNIDCLAKRRTVATETSPWILSHILLYNVLWFHRKTSSMPVGHCNAANLADC